MKAIRKISRGEGFVALVDVEKPVTGNRDVLIEVKRAGVCGTDLHIRHGTFDKVRPPVTLGHEFSGVVVETGPEVSGVTPGDRVTVESAADFCRDCRHCKEGQTQRCEERLGLGYARDGAFAGFVKVRGDSLHRLPDHLSFTEAALTEPAAVAVHAVLERSTLSAGDFVLVTGPGAIGLLTAQTAKTTGATVMITGVTGDELRLETAKGLGIDYCITADTVHLADIINDRTGGEGVDVVFEASGTAAGFTDGIKWLRKGGEICQLGLYGEPVSFDIDILTFKEIVFKGCMTHNRESWKKALSLMTSGKIDTRPLVTDELPLSRWETAFELFERGEGIKYLLYPEPEGKGSS